MLKTQVYMTIPYDELFEKEFFLSVPSNTYICKVHTYQALTYATVQIENGTINDVDTLRTTDTLPDVYTFGIKIPISDNINDTIRDFRFLINIISQDPEITHLIIYGNRGDQMYYQ